MIYVSWELLSVLLSKAKVGKKNAALFLMFILWILMCVRSIYMGISDTSGIYLSCFTRCQSYSLKEALAAQIFINEPLMTVFTWICSKIITYRFYISLCSLFPILSFYWFIKKNTTKPIYGVMVFFSLFYFYESFLIKQLLALSVVLFAFDLLRRKKIVYYAVIICIAGLIHKSAFVLLPVYFICKYIKCNKYYFFFLVLAVVFGMFFGEYILKLLYTMSFYNFESYIKNGIYGTNGRINLSMFVYIFLTVFCYVFTKNNSKDYNEYLVLMSIGCVLNSWSTVVVEFYRVALYFMCPICIVFPEAVRNVPKKHKRIVNLLLSFILLYSFKIAKNCNCLPYYTFFVDWL